MASSIFAAFRNDVLLTRLKYKMPGICQPLAGSPPNTVVLHAFEVCPPSSGPVWRRPPAPFAPPGAPGAPPETAGRRSGVPSARGGATLEPALPPGSLRRPEAPGNGFRKREAVPSAIGLRHAPGHDVPGLRPEQSQSHPHRPRFPYRDRDVLRRPTCRIAAIARNRLRCGCMLPNRGLRVSCISAPSG
jgi:hypothetical protein